MHSSEIFNTEYLQKLIRQARGTEPADLVLKNCHVINVFTREVMDADVAICQESIAGIGKYNGIEEIDCKGFYASPGFIEGHVHIESSLLSPAQFAYSVLPSGTTTVICDPHEIANVLGKKGILYVLDETAGLPVAVYCMTPSCVPATHLESSGAVLSEADIAELLQHPRVLGIAEMMNYPGVLAGDREVLGKICRAKAFSLPIDGHAPGVSGKDIQAYVAAGIGSDHECTRKDEAIEKLKFGMHLFIREGTIAQNLEALIPAINERNMERCLFVTDDCDPRELFLEGHLDRIVRKAVRLGLDPVMAIRMVTINPARYFGLRTRGAIGPGYRADIVLFDDLHDFRPQSVFSGGSLWASQGKLVRNVEKKKAGEYEQNLNSVNILLDKVDFSIPARAGKIRVMGIVRQQLITESLVMEPSVQCGEAVADSGRDLAKVAVVERHHGSGRTGKGFVKGMGMRFGAIAGSVAHDSHNIIVIGMSDADMKLAVKTVASLGGGLVAVADGKVMAQLGLEVAGLMTVRSLKDVSQEIDGLLSSARSLGGLHENPFMIMSFLALPVIPHLKITDMGLVDVDAFEVVDLWL